MVHETESDLAELQQLLDESHERGGAHLREVITPDRRLDAGTLASMLDGMRLLVLATSTADGRPIAGPVDGIFYRGSFHFGSSPDSVRFRHIAKRPAVSASHLPGEHLAVTVHGVAEPIDVAAPEHAGFRQALLDIYVPRFGEEWATFLDPGAVYAWIRAEKIFTFWMPSD